MVKTAKINLENIPQNSELMRELNIGGWGIPFTTKRRKQIQVNTQRVIGQLQAESGDYEPIEVDRIGIIEDYSI